MMLHTGVGHSNNRQIILELSPFINVHFCSSFEGLESVSQRKFDVR